MRLTARALITNALLLGTTIGAAAQPVTENEPAAVWWGAGLWILITVVLLVGAALFVVKGIKRPNR